MRKTAYNTRVITDAPFLIVLCSFLSIFFWAKGCAMGERSSKGTTISSFSFLGFFSRTSVRYRLLSFAEAYLSVPSQILHPPFLHPQSPLRLVPQLLSSSLSSPSFLICPWPCRLSNGVLEGLRRKLEGPAVFSISFRKSALMRSRDCYAT